MKEIDFEKIQITDLLGNDIKKQIIQVNNLDIDFISKQVGNALYVQGSKDLAIIGEKIFNKQKVKIPDDLMDELINIINVVFKEYPHILLRTILKELGR